MDMCNKEHNWSQEELKQIETKGISLNQVEEQIKRFKIGFPFLRIQSPASAERGIIIDTKVDRNKRIQEWDRYLQGGKRVTKFVPASGAASRMFKDLFNFLAAPYDAPTTRVEITFFEGIHRFAFFDTLNKVCKKIYSQSIDDLILNKRYKDVVAALLNKEGLNYGALPKGLLEFHRYEDSTRTAFEEHLQEGADYAAIDQHVYLHFTVSPEHKTLFETLVAEKVLYFENKNGVTYHITFSIQKPATDTIAVDLENNPFKVDGKILFRPAGHGALIENLNEIYSEIIFIKNIDNVVPDRLKPLTTEYKKYLAGVLVSIQKEIFAYLKKLDGGNYSHEELLEMLYFLQDKLCVKNPEIKYLEDAELALYIKSKLNRPIRVCGMVRNEGEPGGGPFFTYNADGTISLQILESSQIDLENPESKKMLAESTYFNPVDLVCGVYRFDGEKFDLRDYVDANTGFISQKSQSGKSLKALELPGLWNGAMSDWNTLFVEVSPETFNPVKTVIDLLRIEHC